MMTSALGSADVERLLAEVRRPSGALDLDKLVALCRARRLDIEEVLRVFKRVNAGAT